MQTMKDNFNSHQLSNYRRETKIKTFQDHKIVRYIFSTFLPFHYLWVSGNVLVTNLNSKR